MSGRPRSDESPSGPDELRARVADLNVNVHKGRRAAHKPLLLLWTLARFAHGEERLPFSRVAPAVGALLDAFGPPHKTSPDYPFWHLQTDGLWVVEGAASLSLGKGQKKPLVSTLKDRDPAGHLAPDVADLLRRQPGLVSELVGLLLGYFPATYHEDLLRAVGLPSRFARGVQEPRPRYAPERVRDPHFRERVLDAYGAQCAVCGFSATLGSDLVGVEAAHIRWHSEDGPDETPNGLALCSLHHKLFDRGAFTLSSDDEYHVTVASRVSGRGSFDAVLLDLHGQPMRRPRQTVDAPAEAFLLWHHREVFREPARP